MAQDTKPEVAAGVPEAMLAMGQHVVESQVRLVSELARCGTPVEASETITRWMGRRMEEFSADQARLMEAWLQTLARTTAIATDGLAAAGHARADAPAATEPPAAGRRARLTA